MYNECRHIFTSGKKCQSPSLKDQSFCYFHSNTRKRPTPANQPYDPYSEPQAAVLALPALEDADAIQLALSDVVLALAANQIDPRRARILIYGLQVASQNNRHRRVAQVREAEGAANLGSIVREIHKHEDGTMIGPEKQTPDPEETAERTRPLTLGELLLRDAEALYGKRDAEGKQATESAPDVINIQATADTSTKPSKACRALHSSNIEPCSRRQGGLQRSARLDQSSRQSRRTEAHSRGNRPGPRNRRDH